MPGKGPPPSPNRRRRNKDPIPPTTVVNDGELVGPELPGDRDWHPMTRKWWDTWRRSPQAKTFLESDWQFLLDTALMHSAMWSKEQWTLAAEVRLRVSKFGATPEDRARLRLRVETPDMVKSEQPEPATVDPRKRLRLISNE